MKQVLLSIVCTMAVTSALAATRDKAAEDAAAVDKIFASFSGDRPGCSVGVFRDGQTPIVRNYGLADLATKAPLTADTVFYMASVSKQFTSLAAATLIADGKLGIDDDIRKWLPELPRYESPVTVRRLMNHTAGVREVLGLFSLAGTQSYETLMPPEVLRMMVRQKELNFTPGSQYTYSNGGYFLLAQVVERAAGQRFDEYARKRILEPLGMTSSYFRYGDNPAGANLAHGYVRDDASGYKVRDTYPGFSGSGGLMSSVNDMAKYDRDLNVGHKVWTDKVRQIMLEPGRLSNGETFDAGDGLHYASGVRVGTLRGQELIEHSGGHAAFSSNYITFPKLKASFVSICNIADSPGKYNWEAAEALYPKAFKGAKPKAQDRSRPADTRQSIPAETITALGVGTALYRSEELDADYRFAREGDGLAIDVFSSFTSGGRPEGFSGLRLEAPDVLRGDFGKLKLQRGANNAVTGFVLETGRLEGGVKFTRVGQ
ncbi:serine hydrolase domain-containing protein [Steroidobacter sp.]|uniref:serine hydrolase domain-containing protein n=1 Tax=Steroidobacter sp. TaxID=1978227 RepID=UPI001A5A44EC|nr:serine hydrolase domain-containing protein [Steroidobacter sp.]MBL8266525.1 beta-lactamase family protein [Steroidobacter sp.]